MTRLILPSAILLILAPITCATPNPSAVYCAQCGYEYQTRTDQTGSQYGWCIFPDGSECTAWSFWYRCHGTDCSQVSCDCHWPCPGPATIIYVDADATGANNGSSWADAHTCLQDALIAAKAGDKPVEIRVAQGLYRPDQRMHQSTGDRDAAFELLNDTTIKGGFAGFGETDPNKRDIARYETILTGDLAGNDAPPTDPRTLPNNLTRAENSYHIVVSLVNDATAGIDGFTITAGNANGSTYTQTYGGGMYVDSSNAVIANCSFKFNSSSGRGGGFYSQSGKNTLFRCKFHHNISWLGGGLCAYQLQRIDDCTFENNIATLNGGGMWGRSRQVSACSFIANHADSSGGGLFNTGNAALTNGLIAHNHADRGGGMYAEDCDISISNCTFAHNSADDHGGLYNDEGETVVTNSIFWANTAASGSTESAQIDTHFVPEIDYCCIEGFSGSLGGTGNLDADPLFADPNATDFHLKSQAGRYNPRLDVWDTDNLTSPCIDAGDQTASIGYESFPNGARVNMGAYGATAQASKSYFDTGPCQVILIGDINGDCKVDFTDFTLMSINWLADSGPQ
mgnify:CR=1 FL=1